MCYIPATTQQQSFLLVVQTVRVNLEDFTMLSTWQEATKLQQAAAVALLLVTLFLVNTVYKASTSPLRSLPGPWLTHFTKRPLQAATEGGRRIFYIHELHQKYGPIVRISPEEVAVADVEAFRQIHAVSGGFSKGDFYTKLTNFPRHSVFTLRDVKEHALRRRLFARGFSKSYMREHFEETVREKVQLAVDKIAEDADEHGGRVDLFKWWSLMSADIVGCLGFGESFGLLELGSVS